MGNFRRWSGLVFAVLLLAASACTVGPQLTPTSGPTPGPAVSSPGLVNVVKNIEPSVVRVDVQGTGFTSSGSGFLIDSRGYVLTNYHVIENFVSINVVTMGTDSFAALPAATDAKRDLAVLKLTSNKNTFPSLSLGSSSDVQVGQEVLAAGFPLGEILPGPASFNRGILSALRNIRGTQYLQTDAVINPGNSGGCLVNSEGQVIGITTSGVVPPGLDAEGIGLAIPIDDARSLIGGALPK